MKYNPALLKESVDKSLELLVQGKLKGPHISGEFELDKVLIPIVCQVHSLLRQSVQYLTFHAKALWTHHIFLSHQLGGGKII